MTAMQVCIKHDVINHGSHFSHILCFQLFHLTLIVSALILKQLNQTYMKKKQPHLMHLCNSPTHQTIQMKLHYLKLSAVKDFQMMIPLRESTMLSHNRCSKSLVCSLSFFTPIPSISVFHQLKCIEFCFEYLSTLPT